MDGQVTLRPVMEDDLSWLAFLNDPAATGPYEWHGWGDPQRLRRSWAESGLLDDDSGALIVPHGTDRVGVVDWQKVQTGRRAASSWDIGIGLVPEFRVAVTVRRRSGCWSGTCSPTRRSTGRDLKRAS